MALNPSLFSSASDEWETPRDRFAAWHAEFGFDLDVAATPENACCPRYLTRADNALAHHWPALGRVAWCNPPYSRPLQAQFVTKAARHQADGLTTVLLLPARTDTAVFHTYLWDATTHRPRPQVELRFLPGRLKFCVQGVPKQAAPFPSLLAVLRPVS